MTGPRALIAELTHRCPLRCVYCSNPVQMQPRANELATAAWARVFGEAAALGVSQLHLTGGEPLARADIAALVRAGREAKLYVNLITSGIGLSAGRMADLAAAGIDHVQLSLQDIDEQAADEIAGARVHARKLAAAEIIRRHPVAFTLNMVVHRRNLDRLDQMIRFAEELGAGRLEVAHVQYYGWALENRSALMPSRAQVERSLALLASERERLKGRMRIEYVVPDYYARYPKACAGGWGRSVIVVDPGGRALPCHAAGVIPGLEFDSVEQRSLEWIWEQSPAFRRFRGEDWMPEPCRTCERRSEDFGGCRCQALLLTGCAETADPVCSLSPAHGIVQAIVEEANSGEHATAWICRGVRLRMGNSVHGNRQDAKPQRTQR